MKQSRLWLIIILILGIIHGAIPVQARGEETFLLYDDFNDGNYNGWEVETGTWTVEDGELSGTGHGGGVDAFIYAGNTNWTDYFFETKVIFKTGTAFLVFRSTEHLQNDYLLQVWWENSRGEVYANKFQLGKHQNGVYTSFTEDLPGAEDGNAPSPVSITNPSIIKVGVSGNNIKIYINNQLIFEINDPDPILNGRIGLANWLYRQDNFDDVKVYRAEEGLVGYWNFNEDSGNTTYDSSGNGNHGWFNGPYWTTGVEGSAVKFDGVNDYVEMMNPINLSNTGFTIAFFICLNSMSEFGVLQVTDGSNGWGIWVGVNDFVFEYWPKPDVWPHGMLGDGQETPPVGVWKYITMVYDDDSHQFLMYGDANLEKKWDINLIMSDCTQPLQMGSPFQVSPVSLYNLHGIIDEVQIYNRSLSKEEILIQYEKYTMPDPSQSQTRPFEGLTEIAFVIIGFGFVAIVGYGIWRQGQPKKRYPRPYSPPVSTKKPPLRKEIPRLRPKKLEEIRPQKPTKPPPDLPLSKPIPEMPKLEPVAPGTLADLEPSKETITKPPPPEVVSEEKRALFSTIQYQTQDLIFEQDDVGPIVRIIPYSGSIKEIKARFHHDQIIMRGNLTRQNLPEVDLELKIEGEPRTPSYDDPWKDISLVGEEKIVKQIKLHSEIATRLTSLGTADVMIESPAKGELAIRLTCNEDAEAIKHAYALIKDLQLFFDISIY